ncbi:aldose epimerase family protein [Nocardioides hwasunensis]|uniref:Aldose 1-epimerase n=1 Tax=Nocardioides hwasunensis TaxID=397258 RepID=A0ABR8MDQ7_9ACTN|nr:aldose epimerase family protein [Nocardioides hwasunensis]MBD3914102.1 galactose mutarotase [Nocardioides hwasunensis]
MTAGDRWFGRLPDGRDVEVVSIGHAPGPVVDVLTLGATVHRLEVSGRDGVRRNVVLGLADVDQRLASGSYIGGTIGRYANRIAAGSFPLDGRQVHVRTHDRGNSLHGGPDGFDLRLWEVREQGPDEVVLALTSPDGDQGFPGTLAVTVGYRVDGDTVVVTMEASTDTTTVVNLTNHAYFDLSGEGSGTIEDHLLQVEADEFTPIDATGIPLDGHAPVAGTPFDLGVATPLGVALASEHPQMATAHGIDHNFVVRGAGLRRAAVLASPDAATELELWSDQPGLQVYTGNALDGTHHSAGGARHQRRGGVALEPQLFPDSPNRPEWPSATLRPGETYHSVIEWRFGGPAGSAGRLG